MTFQVWTFLQADCGGGEWGEVLARGGTGQSLVSKVDAGEGNFWSADNWTKAIDENIGVKQKEWRVTNWEARWINICGKGGRREKSVRRVKMVSNRKKCKCSAKQSPSLCFVSPIADHCNSLTIPTATSLSLDTCSLETNSTSNSAWLAYNPMVWTVNSQILCNNPNRTPALLYRVLIPTQRGSELITYIYSNNQQFSNTLSTDHITASCFLRCSFLRWTAS